MIKPNLLVIGAMKCASTSLHNYLDLHPKIQMSEPKELEFFSSEENFSKGLEWYSQFFDLQYPLRGESSTNYTKRHRFKNVPERINETLGSNVKLIYIVRDPIERFQSHFTDSKTYGHTPSNCDINITVENLSFDDHILQTSKYYYQVKEYLQIFDKKEVYFLKSEDLKHDPQSTLNKVFKFLEVDLIEIIKIESNLSKTKSYPSSGYAQFINIRSIKSLKKLLPNSLISDLKNSILIKKISRKKIDPSIDTLSSQSREKLRNLLREDLKLFKDETGIDYLK
ncbi:sulfotransferase domain-containing protein [Flavobacteriaceae bacterium 14752]|uniref:sulfotransferase domain-containing protein n=1 Tax=Mesohalobacter salilacus TaxID=2491711 RepID=UPI000F63D4BE|nr:hypothetical protein EIG84_01555 [Flavobacteriaceae bacterium 14752]